MQIYAGGNGSFHERFAHAVLTKDDQWDGSLNARAAPRIFPHGAIRRTNQRRLAHVCSKIMQILFPASTND
jgi:hypothetical protein